MTSHPNAPNTGASATAETNATRKLVLVQRDRALVSIVLDRPEALNAFNDDMCRIVSDEIPLIARNPDIYIVTLSSTSPKAFCAGGDVRVLTRTAKTDMARAKAYFAREYQLNWLLECFSKPLVSFIDGICMGSGAGLSLYNTHRVAGENYKFAMPETAIGLFPDVGVSHPLSRLPWPVGLYLGLTGRAMGRADARWLGLATHCIPRSAFDGIRARLADAEPVDQVLDPLDQPQEPGPLQNEWPVIEEFFSPESLAEIFARLQGATGASANWAAQTLADLQSRSPISLAITDRHIRSCRTLDLRQTLIQDYRLGVRCLESSDFYEGVRALLIDKDGKARWKPANFAEISASLVQSYFEPLGDDDLILPGRDEMQALRV